MSALAFMQKYLDRYGSEFPYEIVGEFNGSDQISCFFHSDCGLQWKAKGRGFLHKNTPCPRCSGREKYTTSDEWVQGYERRFKKPFEYEFLEKYKGATKKTLFMHKACGHVWRSQPTKFVSGRGCPKCAGVEKHTPDSWRASFENTHGYKCDFLFDYSDYTGTDSPLEFTHSICGHKWMATPRQVKKNAICPNCKEKSIWNKHSSFAKFQEATIERRPESNIYEYELIGTMNGVNGKTLVKHKPCGHEWEAKLNNLSTSGGCPKCSRTIRYSNKDEWMAEYICRNPCSKIVMSGEYKMAKLKAEFSCENSHTWSATPNSVMNGTGCPHCAKYGFDPTSPARLYYLKCIDDNGAVLYKIGITNRKVMARFKNNKSIVDFKEWHYEKGRDARSLEINILKNNQKHRIESYVMGKGNGHTEFFSRDVLGVF